MTLASAIALRADSGLRLLVTFSDSRLGVPGQSELHTDTAIKSLGLGPKSAVLIAGSTLPVVTAVEGSRGLIANANAVRSEAGEPPLSVLEEARQFATFFGACCQGLSAIDFSTEVLIVGFFGDGEPGLVKFRYARGTFDDEIFRPRKGDFAICSIGDPYFAGIATHAIGSLLAAGTNGQGLLERGGSIFHDVIAHAGAPTIGGGLALGMCRPEHSCWQWPMVSIGARTFYRGLPVAKIPEEWKPATIALGVDSEAFSIAEREQPTEGYATSYPAPLVTGERFVCAEDWVPSAVEMDILTGA